MATIFLPRRAIPAARFAVVVVLPTPPLPDVMTTTLDTMVGPPGSSERASREWGKFFSLFVLEGGDEAALVLQEDLGGAAAEGGGEIVGHEVLARDRDELRIELSTEDARVDVSA